MTNMNEFVDLVNNAQKAVIESQANSDPARFQDAQQKLQFVKSLLNKMQDFPMNEEEVIEFMRAKEAIRRLEETQHAIEATE